MRSAVSGKGLTKQFNSAVPVHALRGVDVEIPAGKFTCIMGPSGSGKSTLLQILAGIAQPTSGEVELGGQRLTDMDDDALAMARRRVGFVFQQFNLLPNLTARQNILLPCDLAGTAPTEAWWERVVATLNLAERLEHLPEQLAGGQAQRVAIARAIVNQPEVVFADEPTGALDQRSSSEVLALLRTLVRELGQTVVMVTHDPAAAAYADEVLLLADGLLVGRIVNPTTTSVLAGLEALGQGAYN
ncbi:ABC transporter ATP-binding protein [Buchananella felis]|uniref:ABC transporter ATP-binding protein n=1 Tax=Buchananella felis TaxID=3231492 RepID=UPI0035281FD7